MELELKGYYIFVYKKVKEKFTNLHKILEKKHNEYHLTLSRTVAA